MNQMIIFKGKEIHPYESFYHDVTENFNRGELGGGISRCVKTTASLATMEEIQMNQNGEEKLALGKIINICSLGSSQNSRVIDCEGIAYTVTNGEKDGMPKIIEPKEQTDRKYRIRKLTPRECFRLMGVGDTDIDVIQQAGISNSQQYKLAGNSIVVDVLYHIFRKAFCKEPQPLYCVKLTNNMTHREPKSTVVALKLNYERKETVRLTNDAFYYLLEGEEPLDEDNLAEALHLTTLHPNGFQINDGWSAVEGSDLIECEIIPYEVEEEEICDYDEYLEITKNCHLRIKHVNDNKVRLWRYYTETSKQEYVGEFQLGTNKFGLVCFQTGPQNEEFQPGKACLYFLRNFKKK